MSIFSKRGSEAVAAATAEKDGKESALVAFPSGTTLKVRVKSAEDSAEYYGYSIFKKVNTFVPKEPAQRNAKGFITGNPTVWDRAAEYYYGLAKQAREAGDEATAKEYSDAAYLYKGKPRYLMGFGSLETGEDIVVDLSAKQAKTVIAAIQKYAKKLDKMVAKSPETGEWQTFQVKSLRFRADKGGDSGYYVLNGTRNSGETYGPDEVDYMIGVAGDACYLVPCTGQSEYWAAAGAIDEKWRKLTVGMRTGSENKTMTEAV
ncbi:hypothetical protein [Brevibacillus borstelensis]|uniref:hypothetical protein n=1 Tax=Brevibacillus borstelensis TaxID=45462 RepID=UPI00287F6F81|nr:hypothetical protein [Brevibacillus borstelensis]WNF07443.1 hypothetical protein RFB14_08560 [Brevibacillus borstelensis]